jgi:diadenosine tetraphosphate (Ap4A) HIT family hydrolase
VSGFNVGMNCGIDSGQTVMHARIHLIPRRHGDMSDPHGGVRDVIPERRLPSIS